MSDPVAASEAPSAGADTGSAVGGGGAGAGASLVAGVPVSAVPGTAGQRLKAERERRGMSAQKAADEMHLDAWVVDALEADDYARIGPAVYAKGHLKKYASILGLPSAELMDGFDPRRAGPTAAVLPSANVRLRTSEQAVSNLPWPQVIGFVVVVAVVAGVVWWKPWTQRSGVSAPTADGALVAATPIAPPVSPVDVPPTAAGDPGAPSAAGALPAAPAGGQGGVPAGPAPVASSAAAVNAEAGSGKARLTLSFSADSWVDVHDATGHRVFAGNGRANSVKRLAGVAPLRVYLGFVSGVQLEINDRAVAIGPQYVNGDVARFEAGADGVLRRDLRNAPPYVAPSNAVRPHG